MAKGFSFEEALQPATKGFSFEEAIQPKPEPVLSPEEQMMSSSVGQVAPPEPNTQNLLAKTTLPANAPAPTGRSFEEVAAGPDVSAVPKFDTSKMPTAEERAAAQFGLTPDMNIGEKALRTGKASLYGAATGLEQTWLGGARMISDLTGLGKEGVEGVSKQLSKEQQAAEQTFAPEYGLKIAKDIGSSVIQNIPIIATGLYGGSSAALSNMFTQSFMQTYDDSRNEGLGVGASTARSAIYGTAEALGESLGLPSLLKGVKDVMKGVPTAELAKDVAKYILKEIPGEQLTYVSQFLTDKGFGLNPEAGMKEFLQGVQDTALVTVGQTAVMGGAGFTTNKILKELRDLHSKGEEGIPKAADMMKSAGFTFEQAQQPTTPSAEVTPAITPEPAHEAAPEAVPQTVTPQSAVEQPAPAVPRAMPGAIQEEDVEPLQAETVTPVTVPQVAPVEAKLPETAAAPQAVAEKPTFDEWRTQQGLTFRSKEDYQAALPKLQAEYEAEVSGVPAAPVAETPEVVKEAKTVEKELRGVRADEVPLHEFNLGIIDAMNKAQPNSELVSEEAIKLLIANELVKQDANKKLELLPKGNQMLNALRDISGFGKPQMDSDQQKAFFAKFIPQITTGEAISAAPKAEEVVKPTETVTPETSKKLKNLLEGRDEYLKVMQERGLSPDYAAKAYDAEVEYQKAADRAYGDHPNKISEEDFTAAIKKHDAFFKRVNNTLSRKKTTKEEKIIEKQGNKKPKLTLPEETEAEKNARIKQMVAQSQANEIAFPGNVETKPSKIIENGSPEYKKLVNKYRQEVKKLNTAIDSWGKGVISHEELVAAGKRRDAIVKAIDEANKAEEDKAKEAHIEGKKSEPVTSKTIEEAIDKAETKVDSKKIKKSINDQFDAAIKNSPFISEKDWSTKKGLKDSERLVTIDIPGDGKFTVKNNAERLKELQKRLLAALPLKTGKPARKPTAASVSAPEKVLADMINDGEMENALEYAKLKKIVPTNAGLTPQGIKNLEKAMGNEKGALELKAEIEGKPVEEVETYQESMDRINAKMKAEGRESEFTKAQKELAATKAKIAELEAKKEEYTAKEREDAEHHAKDLGGEVAYQKGDLALIRGYALLSGAPVYAVAKGDQRSRKDIRSYTGNLVTPSEKAELVKITEQLEKDAQLKHKESPFIKFEKGIALSKDIPADLGGVIKEWKTLLGLKNDIYVSTTQDAKENKANFTGPHRVVGSGTLSTTEAGSMRRMPDGSYYVLFDKTSSKSRMLETIAHELGHVHEREVYSGASPETKKAINDEFQKWVLSQKGKSAEQFINSLRAKTSAKTTSVPAGTKAEDLSPYWKSFGEWYADQVSRWATTTETPLNVVEKFFKRLGNQMRRFYSNLKNKGYLPNETFKQYLDNLVEAKEPVAGTGEEIDSAPQAMAKKIIPRADKVDELLEKYERNDTPLHPSGEVKDAILGSYQKSKKIATKMSENPLMTAVNMVGKADRAITYARNKNVWFGSGLDQADFAKYNGQLRDSQGIAAASIAVTNAIHAGHVGTQVMIQGGLQFDYNPETGKGTQMFRAKKEDFSMANVVRLKHDLEEKLGAQRAANVVNAYFEAKRSRSIVEEFLKREEQYAKSLESGEPEEDAAKNLKNVEVAMQKVNMDDEQIDDFIALEKDYPELRQMMDNWTKVNHNMLDAMAFSGVISKKRATQLKAIKDYVPWYRIMDEQADIHQAVGVRGMTNVGQEKKFREGEVNRDIDDIVDNMIHNVMMMTRNSMKNYAANRVAIEYATRKDNGKLQLYPTEGTDAKGVRANIIINGRRAIVNFPDPLVAEAVLGMENIEIPMISILSFFANGLRRGITTFPVFQVSQLFMDAPTAAWVSGVKSPLKLIGNTFGGFVRALLPNDPIVQMLKSYGIGGYQSSARTPEKELKIEIGLLDKSVWAKTMKTLDHIGDASDYAQRRAIYKQVLKETGDEMQALIQANNVIDFLKRGSGKGAQFVTRTVSFMNAYAQSIDVLAQALAGSSLKGKSRKAAQAQMMKTGLLLSGLTILYCMAAGADDEYDKLDDQTKLRNIIIPGTKIRLPMHTSASFFFKAIPELIYNKVMKEGTKNQIDNTRLRKALGVAAIDSLLGPNMIPTGVKPVAEIALNHNFFTGGTLTPKGMEKLESFRQYTSSTSELGKVMSALTMGALNPIEMDHLMRGLFGTAGAAVMYGSNLLSGDRVEPQAKDNPLYGSFMLAEVPRGREDLFYDLKERSDKKYETFVDLMKKQHTREGQLFREENKGLVNAHGFVTQADADLKRINAEVRRISDLPESKMSSQEKRDRITKFQETKNNILEQTIKFRLKAGL